MKFFKIFFSFFLCFCQVTLNAETVYMARDLGTLTTDRSSARIINQAGNIAGKFFDKNNIVDYIWSFERGLQVITSNGIKDVFPRLNNLGQVAGVFIQTEENSWLGIVKTRTKINQLYLFDPEQGLKILGIPSGWENETITLIDMNDKGQILIANHPSVLRAKKFALWEKGKFIVLKTYGYTPVAINNQSDVLLFFEKERYLSFLNEYVLQVFNYETKEHFNLAEDKFYRGRAINDNCLVIATDKSGRQGFLGSRELGMVDLGPFIPRALNNQGEMVGKILTQDSEHPSSVWLRKVDGSLINLNDAVDRQLSSIAHFEEIIDVWSINDQGQIAATAKIGGQEHGVLLDPHLRE